MFLDLIDIIQLDTIHHGYNLIGYFYLFDRLQCISINGSYNFPTPR